MAVRRVVITSVGAVSPLGLGTWAAGGPSTHGGLQSGWGFVDDRELVLAMERGIAMGVNLIDTARAYGSSEEVIGRALQTRRQEYVLVTKVGAPPPDATASTVREHVANSLADSLRALRTADRVFDHHQRQHFRRMGADHLHDGHIAYRRDEGDQADAEHVGTLQRTGREGDQKQRDQYLGFYAPSRPFEDIFHHGPSITKTCLSQVFEIEPSSLYTLENRFCPRSYAEFMKYTIDMSLDCPYADTKSVGDFFIVEASRCQF